MLFRSGSLSRARRSTFARSLCILLLTQLLALSQSAFAQDDAPAPAEIDRLVAELEDPTQRAALVRRLRALQRVASEPPRSTPAASLGAVVDRVGKFVVRAGRELRAIPPRELGHRVGATALLLLFGWFLHGVGTRGLGWLSRGFVQWTRGSSGIALEGARTEASSSALFDGVPRRLVTLGISAATLLAVLEVWSLELTGELGGLLGEELFGRVMTVLLLGFTTVLVWIVVDALVDGFVRVQLRKRPDARHRDRLQTVAPLLRGVCRFLIGGVGILSVLASVGVDVTPVLASAGVLGLAVGFGAQSLVRDLLNGFTLVVEDACAVEDWVEIAGHQGLVEHMGLRAMRLRDLSGTVHFVPYSEIGTVRNYTQKFAYAWLDVPVAYDADLEAVFALAEEVGRELRHDPAFTSRVLGDPEIFGVTELGERGPVVTLRMKTVSVERWAVGREYLKRLKARLDSSGLPVPFPQVRLHGGPQQAPREGAEFRRLEAAA